LRRAVRALDGLPRLHRQPNQGARRPRDADRGSGRGRHPDDCRDRDLRGDGDGRRVRALRVAQLARDQADGRRARRRRAPGCDDHPWRAAPGDDEAPRRCELVPPAGARLLAASDARAGRSGRVGVMTSPLLAPRKAATYRSLLFLCSPLLIAPLALAVLLAGWITTAVLAITPLVIPVLIGFRGAVGLSADGESSLAHELLGAETHGGRLTSGGRGFWGRGKAVVTDPGFWRPQAYLVARMLVGFPLAVLFVSLAGASLWFVGLPVYYRWTDVHVGS